jgi:hypothetical protein
MEEKTKLIILLAIISILLATAVVVQINENFKLQRTPGGIPIGIVYSNRTYIRLDGTSQMISVACQPMSETNVVK